MAVVYLSLGTNLGKRKENLKQAIKKLGEQFLIEKVSPIYETDPVGYTQQPLFLNIVLTGTTKLKPKPLLAYIKDIEAEMGRKTSFPNAPRPIDIDILFYDNKIISSKNLIVPHPHLTVRAFVLVPLNDISPELVHPCNGRKTRRNAIKLAKISKSPLIDFRLFTSFRSSRQKQTTFL